jgi:hypothetical protein
MYWPPDDTIPNVARLRRAATLIKKPLQYSQDTSVKTNPQGSQGTSTKKCPAVPPRTTPKKGTSVTPAPTPKTPPPIKKITINPGVASIQYPQPNKAPSKDQVSTANNATVEAKYLKKA